MTKRQFNNPHKRLKRNTPQSTDPVRSEPPEWPSTVGNNAPPPDAPQEVPDQKTTPARGPTGQASARRANTSRRRGHGVRFGEQPGVISIERGPSTGHDKGCDRSANCDPSTNRDGSRGRPQTRQHGRRQNVSCDPNSATDADLLNAPSWADTGNVMASGGAKEGARDIPHQPLAREAKRHPCGSYRGDSAANPTNRLAQWVGSQHEIVQDGWPRSGSGVGQTGHRTDRSPSRLSVKTDRSKRRAVRTSSVYHGRTEDQADYTDYNRGRSASRDWYADRSEKSESKPRTRRKEYSHPEVLYGVAWEKDPDGQYSLPILKCYEEVPETSATSGAHFVGRETESKEVTTQGHDFQDRWPDDRHPGAVVAMRIMVRICDGSENVGHASERPFRDLSVGSAHPTAGCPDSSYTTYEVEEQEGDRSWKRSRRQSRGLDDLPDAGQRGRRGRRASSVYYSRGTSFCSTSPLTAESHLYRDTVDRAHDRPPPHQLPGILKPPPPELPPRPGQQPRAKPQPYPPEPEYSDAGSTEPMSGGSDTRGRSYSSCRSPWRSESQKRGDRYSTIAPDSDGNERLVYDNYYGADEGSGYESTTPLFDIMNWVRYKIGPRSKGERRLDLGDSHEGRRRRKELRMFERGKRRARSKSRTRGSHFAEREWIDPSLRQ